MTEMKNLKGETPFRNAETRYITMLSVLSAFAVLFLHANGCFWTFSTKPYWQSANIIECVFYFAVPVFFMITGATLIDYPERYSLKEYFIRRIRKTVIPFLAWSAIGLGYRVLYGKNLLEGFSVEKLVELIFSSKIISYYWFFPSLFCVYLCIPLLASVQKEKRNQLFLYLLSAGIFFNNLLPFLKNVFHWTYTFPITVDVTGKHLVYVILGVVLNENRQSKRTRWLIYLFGIAGLLVHITATWKLSIAAGKIVQTYKGYTSFPCILWSAAVFVFVKQTACRVKSGKVWKIVNILGKYTLPVYLLQWFVFDQIKRHFAVNVFSLWYRLGIPFLMVPVIIAVTWIIRKIPGLRRIVP